MSKCPKQKAPRKEIQENQRGRLINTEWKGTSKGFVYDGIFTKAWKDKDWKCHNVGKGCGYPQAIEVSRVLNLDNES